MGACFSPPPLSPLIQTRGNQRDTDRARAAARAAKVGKKPDDGLTPLQRKER
jgi:hypothetical protein